MTNTPVSQKTPLALILIFIYCLGIGSGIMISAIFINTKVMTELNNRLEEFEQNKHLLCDLPQTIDYHYVNIDDLETEVVLNE